MTSMTTCIRSCFGSVRPCISQSGASEHQSPFLHNSTTGTTTTSYVPTSARGQERCTVGARTSHTLEPVKQEHFADTATPTDYVHGELTFDQDTVAVYRSYDSVTGPSRPATTSIDRTLMGQPTAQDSAVYASSVGNGNSAAADNYDWEYEYDDNETEDFYLTLDLTTHVPNALVQAEASLQAHRKTALSDSARHSAVVDTPNGETADSSDEEDEPSAGQLQIVGLHTARPLVKLDENVYNCAWSTDLGTQFHIAKAGDVSSTVRRAGTVLDIIGTSQVRLLGIPVTLQPRNDVHRSRTPSTAANNALSVNARTESEVDADQASERSTPAAPGGVAESTVPLQIDRIRVKHQAGAQQASFLERLSQIKLKKGETDQVPIYSVKQYHHVDPARQAELKQAGRALDAQRKAKAKEDEVVATGQRPRKRRRKLTYAEKGVERGNQAGAGRQARDAVAQRLGFSDDAPPSNRNGRWARQTAPTANMAYTTDDAPGSALTGQETGEATMSARQGPDTTTLTMPDAAIATPIILNPQESTTISAVPAAADSGPAVVPPKDSNEGVSPSESAEAPNNPV